MKLDPAGLENNNEFAFCIATDDTVFYITKARQACYYHWELGHTCYGECATWPEHPSMYTGG